MNSEMVIVKAVVRKHATVKYGSTVHSSVVVCDCHVYNLLLYLISSKNFGIKIIILEVIL